MNAPRKPSDDQHIAEMLSRAAGPLDVSPEVSAPVRSLAEYRREKNAVAQSKAIIGLFGMEKL